MPADLIRSLFSDLWSVFLIVLFFGGSIFVHELGHFLAARRRGLQVERFSIGFGPKIVAWKGRDGVEYRLSWLPLGGYVALPQLADMRGIEGETTDAAHLPPIGYADKMIVSVMGAVFNVLFAFLLACVVWVVGQPTTAERATTQIGAVLPTIELPDRTEVPGPAAVAGLRPGDTVLRIDGRRVRDWMDLHQTLVAGTGRAPDGSPQAVFTIEREGRELQVVVNPQLSGADRFRRIGIEPAEDLVVAEVLPESPASAAGLQPRDRIVAVGGQPVFKIEAFRAAMQAHAESGVAVTVLRDGQPTELFVRPRLENDERTGQQVARAGFLFASSYRLIYPAPWTQIADNARMTFQVLGSLLSPRSDIGLSHLSGPPGIARAYLALSENFRLVLWFTILINVNLAILNLLPIPVLDGGHMLFATIAKLRGRALPPSLVQNLQGVFIVLLFSLMIYVSFFDIRRWVRDSRTDPAQVEHVTPTTP